LNKEAADDLRANRETFKRNVRASMSGSTIRGQTFDRVLFSQPLLQRSDTGS
jgi:hypothetical protein